MADGASPGVLVALYASATQNGVLYVYVCRAAAASGSSTSLLVSVGFYSYPFLSHPLRTSLFLVL